MVNISSVGADTVHPYATAYSASKAAISHFTNCLAPELKEYGITVFALAPKGPTSMRETLANAENLSRKHRERYRRVLEEVGQAQMQGRFILRKAYRVERLRGRTNKPG